MGANKIKFGDVSWSGDASAMKAAAQLQGYRIVTGATNVQSTDVILHVDATAAVTLPDCATLPSGWSVRIAAASGRTVTVNPQPTQSINQGAAGAGVTVNALTSKLFFTNGGNWWTG